jgi:Protein of unknown function (DUF3105)
MTEPMRPPGDSSEAAPKRRRRLAPIAVSALAAVLVLGGALAVPVFLSDKDTKTSRAVTDLSAVQTFEVAKPRHVSGKVAYAQSPPVGGNHNPIWLECGRYAKPVRNEYAVHDLEHGTVWITYRPDMSPEDVALLATSLPAEGIMSPYDGLTAPAVVTMWGVQLQLSGPEDPRLALFLQKYGDGSTSPEPEADCTGGVGTPIAPAINA